jgi:hypothetical protein
MYEQNVIDALARLRDLGNLSLDEREAFQALDDAGVFAAIDEQAQTAQAEEILQGGRALDPSVWSGEARHPSFTRPHLSVALEHYRHDL